MLFIEMWIDVESVIQNEVSQKKNNNYILVHVCGILKNDTAEPICRAGMKMQT